MKLDLNKQTIYENFFQDKDNYKNFVFYGAGPTGDMIVDCFKKENMPSPLAYCDSNTSLWGTYKNAVPIMSLDDAIEKYKDAYFFVTACHWAFEIIPMLEKVIPKDKILFFTSTEYLELDDFRAYYKNNQNEFEEVVNLFEDELSKKVYFNVLEGKNTGDYAYYEKAFSYNQYFDEEVISFTENEVFVDCGGYIGDTALKFINACNQKYRKVFVCEPNYENFSKIEELQSKYPNITLIKKGISNKAETLKFNSSVDILGSACICEDGDISVEVDFIDNLIDEEVTFIKMDIESFEMEALKGAINTIKNYKPKLAICLYHKTSDFIDIPKFINDLNLGYKLYVRHYTWSVYETVLYAL